MKTSELFEKTLEALRQRQVHHNSQLGLINSAISSLKSGKGLVYEAHIQTSSPDHRSIMAEGVKLEVACERARKLWIDYNHNGQGRYNGSVEVFVRVNGLRMAVMQEDAVAIMADESGVETPPSSFKLDDRVSKFPNPMVFKKSDTKLPSAWYTTLPTPLAYAEAVPA